MISIIQGTLGSGKSVVSLLLGLRHLEIGGVLALNYDLVDDWSLRMADRNIYVRLGLWDRQELAESYYRRCFKIGSAESLYKLSPEINKLVCGSVAKRREGKALLIMDEAHLYFNSRNWKENTDFIKFFSQSRKLMYDVYLVAHGIEMLDKQIRFFVEIEERFRNLRKMKMPWLPFNLPINAFLIGRYYHGLGLGRGMRHSTDLIRFNKYYADLYDSFELFDPTDLIDEAKPQGPPPGEKKHRRKNIYAGNIKGPYSILPGNC